MLYCASLHLTRGKQKLATIQSRTNTESYGSAEKREREKHSTIERERERERESDLQNEKERDSERIHCKESENKKKERERERVRESTIKLQRQRERWSNREKFRDLRRKLRKGAGEGRKGGGQQDHLISAKTQGLPNQALNIQLLFIYIGNYYIFNLKGGFNPEGHS